MATSPVSQSPSSSPTLPRSPSQEALVTKVAQANLPQKDDSTSANPLNTVSSDPAKTAAAEPLQSAELPDDLNSDVAEIDRLIAQQSYSMASTLLRIRLVKIRKAKLPVESTLAVVCQITLARISPVNSPARTTSGVNALFDIDKMIQNKKSWDQSPENMIKTYQNLHKSLLEIQSLLSGSTAFIRFEQQVKDQILECEKELEKLQTNITKKQEKVTPDSAKLPYDTNSKLEEAYALITSEKYNDARFILDGILIKIRKANLPVESTWSPACKIALARCHPDDFNKRDHWVKSALFDIRMAFKDKNSWDQTKENLIKTYQAFHKCLLEIQQLSSDSKITSENQKQIKDTIQECETELEKLQSPTPKKVTPGGDDSGRLGKIFIAVVLGALAVVAVAVLYRRHIIKNPS